LTVNAAANVLLNMLLQYKGYGLSVGSMIVGTDKNGTDLYFIDNEWIKLKGNLFSCGSGSIFAYPYLDTSVRNDLSKE